MFGVFLDEISMWVSRQRKTDCSLMWVSRVQSTKDLRREQKLGLTLLQVGQRSATLLFFQACDTRSPGFQNFVLRSLHHCLSWVFSWLSLGQLNIHLKELIPCNNFIYLYVIDTSVLI